jgi:hypothetical protein
MGFLALLVIVLLCAPAGAAQPQMNKELHMLYKADQADREGENIDWNAVSPRDLARQQRVRELAAEGALRHSADFLHAAMVYQHGDSPEFFRQAQWWALRAVEIDPANSAAGWHARPRTAGCTGPANRRSGAPNT